jgi:hypothetical protein
MALVDDRLDLLVDERADAVSDELLLARQEGVELHVVDTGKAAHGFSFLGAGPGRLRCG